jgi:hypothetical protein
MKKFLDSRIVTTVLVLVVLFFLVSWGVNKYLDLKADYRISQQNESALKDSLRVTENKVGDLVFSKQTLVAKNESDLKDLNANMAEIVKNFSGKIHELSNLVAEIDRDTVVIDNTKLIEFPNGDSGIAWESSETYDAENSRDIAGVSKFNFDSITNLITPLETIITRDKIRFNVTQGLRTTDDDKVEMFASSNYPNFAATDLNSAIIDPKTHPALKKFTKQKRFGLGVYTGFGGTINLSKSLVTFGPQVGLGITYRLW